MYKCEKHVKLDSHWCEDGERTTTIYIEHCVTCGNFFGVRLK